MRKTITTTLFLIPLLAGCGHTPTVQSVVAPLTYKIDLQQGNVVTQEMVAKLRQGMTQPQVRYVMGSPLVTDAFHPDRWDYVYLYEKGHKITEHHRLTVIFADGKLARLEGDVTLQDALSAPEKTPDTPAVTTTPTTAPNASTPVQPSSTQATDVTKPDVPVAPAQPVATQTEAAKPEVAAQPDAATPAADSSTKTDKPTAEADATKSSEDQKPKQRGFFGRMLDKIGL